MILWSIITLLLTTAYLLLFLVYDYGWMLQKYFTVPKTFVPQTRISVVIAARNEELYILDCVRSILQQNYPEDLLELIVVDDHSTDRTAEILQQVSDKRFRLLQLSDYVEKGEEILSFKKKALEIGIQLSTGTLIVTTDADCLAPKHWLKNIACLYEQSGAQMIVAPVRFITKPSLLHYFQSIDFATMQGITAATVRLDLGIMCNGANLAFERQQFLALGGYSGVDHLVSGDDYLLQYKFKQSNPTSVVYLKSRDAIIDTYPQNSWLGFFQQRIRWASKSGRYDDPKMTYILALVYGFNLFVVITFFNGLLNPTSWSLFWVVFLVKLVSELIFLYRVAHFFGHRKSLLIFPFLQPLHIVYIIVAGFLSRVSVFEWKQRKFKQ